MTKILLVEDDKSLREIYGVRLLAEGYDIVSADNGEEALAVAIKERPQLIITDVMMPKISGFDMLDILRSTTETRDIKVIMMTALGSEENRERSERLGADRYLVKSQVGIEDVVRAVHDLLGDQAPAAPGAMPGASLPPAAPLPPLPTATPSVPPSAAGRGLVSAPAVAAPGMPANQATPAPTTPVNPLSPDPTAADSPSRRARIIQPINDPTKSVDLQALVDKELAKEGAEPPTGIDEAREEVENQIDSFVGPSAPTPTSDSSKSSDDTTSTDTIAISSDGTLNDTAAPSTTTSTADAAVSPAPTPPVAPVLPPAAPATPPAAASPATSLPPVAAPSAPAVATSTPATTAASPAAPGLPASPTPPASTPSAPAPAPAAPSPPAPTPPAQ